MLFFHSQWQKTSEFPKVSGSLWEQEREGVSSDNEQKFSINLMHVRFSKDELCVAKLLLSSPVYG